MRYRAQDSGLRAKDKTGQRVKENDFFLHVPCALGHTPFSAYKMSTIDNSLLHILLSSLIQKNNLEKTHENSNKILQTMKLSSKSFQYGRRIEKKSWRGS